MKKGIIFILFILFSCSEPDDKDKTPPGVVTLSGNYYSSKVTLSWTAVSDKDLKHYELSQSTDGTKIVYKVIKKIASDTIQIEVLNLTNELKHYFKMSTVDKSGNKSAFSNVVELTPTTGGALLSSAWADIKAKNYDMAISTLEIIVDINFEASDDANIALAWCYLKRANGDKSSSDLVKSVSHFQKVAKDDSYAGLSILGLLVDDYTLSSSNADKLKSKSTYVHANLPHINHRYVMIHGAYSYWFNGATATVNAYLDVVKPSNAPHSLTREGQLAALQSLVGELDTPINIKDIKIK